MDERLYRFLKYTAFALAIIFLGWILLDSDPGREPGNAAYHAGNTLFEDEAYDRALLEYENALQENPDHIHALRGRARTLMQLERYDEALDAFSAAIVRAPEVGFTYANRGILHDRRGEYELAIRDYEQAMSLDPETAEGPNWLTRFLRLQPDKPPGVAERAAYLRAELAKPEDQRRLRVPEIDDAQRPYKQ
ncbi:MAG: tetratricopeptide repeat protein [Gammaproteobacteria bacterium]|nr:tetratricopeptide repeat protein [Gammaproteobacteria bacterium]